MKVHFKGTRGAIPTAPDALDIREKVVAALLAARAQSLLPAASLAPSPSS